MILILYPRRRIEEWVESNLPSLTAPHSSWGGALRLENSNLNLAPRRLNPAISRVPLFCSATKPLGIFSEGWVAHGTAFKGDILPGRRELTLTSTEMPGASQETRARRALKHGVGGGQWEGAGGELCTRAQHGDSRVWSNLLTGSTPSSPVFLPGVKASIRFLPFANHTHTHSQQPRQCTLILACPCSPSQHQKFTESPIPWTLVTSDRVNITQAQLRWCH